MSLGRPRTPIRAKGPQSVAEELEARRRTFVTVLIRGACNPRRFLKLYLPALVLPPEAALQFSARLAWKKSIPARHSVGGTHWLDWLASHHHQVRLVSAVKKGPVRRIALETGRERDRGPTAQPGLSLSLLCPHSEPHPAAFAKDNQPPWLICLPSFLPKVKCRAIPQQFFNAGSHTAAVPLWDSRKMIRP